MNLNAHSQSGLHLLEILISLLILSIALFALLTLQINTQRLVNNSQLRMKAAQQINNLSERLSLSASPNISQWNQHNQQLLPQSKGTLSLIGEQHWQIQLNWHNSIQQSSSCSATDSQSCIQRNIYR